VKALRAFVVEIIYQLFNFLFFAFCKNDLNEKLKKKKNDSFFLVPNKFVRKKSVAFIFVFFSRSLIESFLHL
jgi:hypothetical protein